ncbi:MAG TPA: MFS transporter [Patescibacteria group bacterium]|nr:MFS transporter [Patescibacteria group bacterium]
MFSVLSRRYLSFTRDAVWSKVLLFCFILFLARLSDGIISFWAPVQIQSVLGSPTVMGLIISFQSVVGFIADLVFPTMLRSARARGLVFWGIMTSGFTSFFLVNSIFWPYVAIFLITMALWGIYYELISFANYQFMGSAVPLNMRSSAWAIAGIFVNLAYFLGPLLAAYLLFKGYVITEAAVIGFLVAALVLLLVTEKSHENNVSVDLVEINPATELKHWFTLSKHVWPAIVISLLLGAIDSTFWTTGAVWTEQLAKQSFWGGLFLPIYQFPAIVTGFLVARWGIYKGKKILSEKMLIVAGFFLIGLSFSGVVAWQLSMVFLSSIAISISYPLIEGVYSDIVARMGKEKKEMIGLTSSVVNISYVVWPPIAGLITTRVGERMTFGVVGAITVVTAIILIFVTPKKLRLPQEEIKKWE